MSSRSSEVTRDTRSLNGHMFFPMSLPARVCTPIGAVGVHAIYIFISCFTMYVVRVIDKN